MYKYSLRHIIVKQIITIIVAAGIIVPSPVFASINSPDDTLAVQTPFNPMAKTVNGIRDAIIFNMKDRGMLTSSQENRKWAFWKKFQENSIIYQRSSDTFKGQLMELVANSFDAVVDKVDALGIPPEYYNAMIVVEAFFDGDFMVLRIYDNGRSVALKPGGVPKKRYRDFKRQFGNAGAGVSYAKKGASGPGESIAWTPLEDGTMVEMRINRKKMPDSFFIGKNEVIILDGSNENVADSGFKRDVEVANLTLRGMIEMAEGTEPVLYEGEDDKILAGANAKLLTSGKILLSPHLRDNSLGKLRAIVHEEVEAVMQIISRQDHLKYTAMRDLLLKYPEVVNKYNSLSPQGKYNPLNPDLMANDMAATAFELLALLEKGLIDPEKEINDQEKAYLRAVKPLIDDNRHNYFTSIFWDQYVRELEIRAALASGQRFYEVASHSDEDLFLPELIREDLEAGRYKEAQQKMHRGLDLFKAREKSCAVGTNHEYLLSFLKVPIKRIPAASEEELEFTKNFFAGLCERDDIPRTTVLTGLVDALVERRKTGETGGLNDIDHIRRLDAVLDKKMLSRHKRNFIVETRRKIKKGKIMRHDRIETIFDEFLEIILLEGGTADLPSPPHRYLFQEGTIQNEEELARTVDSDMPGSAILRRNDGKLVLGKYKKMIAQSEPYFTVIIDQYGFPHRVVLKNKEKKHPKDHTTHMNGNRLFSAINIPDAWVDEHDRYIYIREIRGMDITDFFSDISSYAREPDILEKFFYSFGMAMAEAHILGAEDRPHNLIVKLHKLREYPADELKDMAKRAIINIDRENVLTPRYLAKEPENDLTEIAGAFVSWAGWVVPQDKRFFADNLESFLMGIRDGYVVAKNGFIANEANATEAIIDIAGEDLADAIIERLTISDDRIDKLIDNIRTRIGSSGIVGPKGYQPPLFDPEQEMASQEISSTPGDQPTRSTTDTKSRSGTKDVNELFTAFTDVCEYILSRIDRRYRAVELTTEIVVSKRACQGESLILYADDILSSTMAVDLQYSLKEVLASHSTLSNGKIILFAREEASARILENLIKNVREDLDTIIITENELQARKGLKTSESEELQALASMARIKGANDLLGIIRGSFKTPEDLRGLGDSLKTPIIVMGYQSGIYSFSQAIDKAARTKDSHGKNGWIITLSPIKTIDEDLMILYKEYLNNLTALVAA